jgi:hypothetical protein
MRCRLVVTQSPIQFPNNILCTVSDVFSTSALLESRLHRLSYASLIAVLRT